MSATVIVTDRDNLKLVLTEVLQELGLTGQATAPVSRVDDEVSTPIARKLLADKGYNVKSCQALNNLMETYNVVAVKRGRDNWYKGSDIERIPAKR